MAKIFFSLSGEGRGHATRVRTVVEELRRDHSIRVFAPGDAFDFLAPLYAGTDIEVHPIPGLRFHYDSARRLHFGRTVRSAMMYLRRFPSLLAEVGSWLDEERPDLVVADFEPALPRAARSRNIPFISLTHQHFLLTYDLSSLPLWLRAHTVYMQGVVRSYYSGQRHSIVSSFYFPSLRRGCREVTQVGVMLRPELREATPCAGKHLIAYLRRFAGSNVLEALAATGRRVRIYGLGEHPACGRLTFHAIDEARFVDDLVSCEALIATAGNQLVGEALFLGKPCFLMPEARNYEQFINAHFLAQAGGGSWVEIEKVNRQEILRFLRSRDQFAARIDRQRLDGLPSALYALNRHLPGTLKPAPAYRPQTLPALIPSPTL